MPGTTKYQSETLAQYHNVAYFLVIYTYVLYCSLSYRLLEETEDEVLSHPPPLLFVCVCVCVMCATFSKQMFNFFQLSERIKGGSIQVGGVGKALCHDLTNYCNSIGYN